MKSIFAVLVLLGFSTSTFAQEREIYVGKDILTGSFCQVEIISVTQETASFRLKTGAEDKVIPMQRSSMIPLLEPGKFWTMEIEPLRRGHKEKISYVNMAMHKDLRQREGISFFAENQYVGTGAFGIPVENVISCVNLQLQPIIEGPRAQPGVVEDASGPSVPAK